MKPHSLWCFRTVYSRNEDECHFDQKLQRKVWKGNMHLLCLQLDKRSKDQGCFKMTPKTDNAKSYPKNDSYTIHYNSCETFFFQGSHPNSGYFSLFAYSHAKYQYFSKQPDSVGKFFGAPEDAEIISPSNHSLQGELKCSPGLGNVNYQS